jgi:hypothetical protein
MDAPSNFIRQFVAQSHPFNAHGNFEIFPICAIPLFREQLVFAADIS